MKALISVIFGLAIALLLGEAVTRIWLPVSPGTERIDANGESVRNWAVPNTQYFQVAREYKALTTIDSRGHRELLGNHKPEVIFLGDSFTFGIGLHDDETMSYLYQQELGIPVANLGHPGVGTIYEIDRLQRALTEYNWRPRKVMLFMFASVQYLLAGNDLYDIVGEARKYSLAEARSPEEIKAIETAVPAKSKPAGIGSILGPIMRVSNLARVMKFVLGPTVQAKVKRNSSADEVQLALDETEIQLAKLAEIAIEYGFELEIFLISPSSDVANQNFMETVSAINAISPQPVVPIAPIVSDDVTKNYYSYDSHWTPLGTRKVAEYLIAREKESTIESGS
jgi:hypothetical protein